MAVIKPLRGIRYSPGKIEDMSTVISQPYDRIRHGLQEKYYELSDFYPKVVTGLAALSSDPMSISELSKTATGMLYQNAST